MLIICLVFVSHNHNQNSYEVVLLFILLILQQTVKPTDPVLARETAVADLRT